MVCGRDEGGEWYVGGRGWVSGMWEGEVVSGCGRMTSMWEGEWYVRGICTVISIIGMWRWKKQYLNRACD